jgi:hypothetical protein
VTLYAQSRPARVDQRLSSRSLVQAIRRANLALRGYNPDQPRHPAGSPDGGRWRDDGRFDVAVNAPRPPRAGPWPNASPGQQARLAASRLQADAAVARVRERDPNWKPRPSIVEPTIEGEIARNEHVAREARARLETLQQGGIGPGPFAVESIPARNSSRNFTASERAEVDRIGAAVWLPYVRHFRPRRTERPLLSRPSASERPESGRAITTTFPALPVVQRCTRR